MTLTLKEDKKKEQPLGCSSRSNPYILSFGLLFYYRYGILKILKLKIKKNRLNPEGLLVLLPCGIDMKSSSFFC